MLARTLEVYEGSESMHRTQYTTRKATKPCGWCDSAVAKAVRDIDLTRKLGSPNTCLLQNRGQVCPDCTSVGFGQGLVCHLASGSSLCTATNPAADFRMAPHEAQTCEGGTFVRLLRPPGGLKRLIQNEIRRITIIHNV